MRDDVSDDVSWTNIYFPWRELKRSDSGYILKIKEEKQLMDRMSGFCGKQKKPESMLGFFNSAT